MPRRSLAYKEFTAIKEGNLEKLEEFSILQKTVENSFPDATAMIPGTGPEKMVYNFLLRLGVNFQFQYHQEDYENTAANEELFIPDFTLPDYNIHIEVYGNYWHSDPSQRESDIKKFARHLYANQIIIEHGIPSYPEGGGFNGKYVIWWENEIYISLGFLFARDLPELLDPNVIKGKPAEFLQDRKAVIEEERARISALKAGKMVQRIEPFARELSRLRKKTRDLTKIYPFLKEYE